MMQAVMIVRNVAMMVVESSVLSHCQNPMLINHARPCHVSSITAQPKRRKQLQVELTYRIVLVAIAREVP